MNISAKPVDQCKVIKKASDFYILTLISIVGMILNAMCIVVFLQTKIHKNSRGQMFRYLLFKSIFDFLILLLRAVNPILECENCSFSGTYELHIIEFIIGDYLKQIIQLLSMFCHIAADMDRYLVIRNKHTFFNKYLPYQLVIFLFTLFTCSFYVFRLFETDFIVTNQIVKGNMTILKYKSVDSKFSSTTTYQVLLFIHGLSRDVICVTIILVLNLLILREFKIITLRKKNLTRLSSNSISVQKLESRTTIMVLVIGFLTWFGHFPNFFKYIPFISQSYCFRAATLFLNISSISFNIVFYYLFNRVFKKCLIQTFCRVVYRYRPGSLIPRQSTFEDGLSSVT